MPSVGVYLEFTLTFLYLEFSPILFTSMYFCLDRYSNSNVSKRAEHICICLWNSSLFTNLFLLRTFFIF